MFKIKLNPRYCQIEENQVRIFGGDLVPLPPALAPLARLKPEGQTYQEILEAGLSHDNIRSLLEKGLACFGHGEAIFPYSARSYFEEQFPRNIQARPLEHWLSSPAPPVAWIGLPFANLMSIRHSTAAGMAAILDALPEEDDYVLAVLPYLNPSRQLEEDMENMVRAVAETPVGSVCWVATTGSYGPFYVPPKGSFPGSVFVMCILMPTTICMVLRKKKIRESLPTPIFWSICSGASKSKKPSSSAAVIVRIRSTARKNKVSSSGPITMPQPFVGKAITVGNTTISRLISTFLIRRSRPVYRARLAGAGLKAG